MQEQKIGEHNFVKRDNDRQITPLAPSVPAVGQDAVPSDLIKAADWTQYHDADPPLLVQYNTYENENHSAEFPQQLTQSISGQYDSPLFFAGLSL